MYDMPARDESISKTVENLKANNFIPFTVNTKEEALAKIKELIPSGASVMNGASKTLEQIGYIDYLKSGQHPWVNLHEAVLKEKDPAKQSLLRKHSTASDFYLGSVHGLTEAGEMLVASNTGSQIPGLSFNADNVILVVGSQKIVPDLSEAFKRVDVYVVPLEDARMMGVYNAHTLHSKTFIYHKERAGTHRKVNVIIVKEKLGF